MLSTRVGISALRLSTRAPPQRYDLHRIMQSIFSPASRRTMLR
jgi:hypothetical protein